MNNWPLRVGSGGYPRWFWPAIIAVVLAFVVFTVRLIHG